ncbi:MAG TPA: DNA polymerase III subunit gamma/tau, partial [Gammaproteobacteria bacterium]|nr:DNA polymerase III subunit gamma/tau [Gammaproteobacteria bacterium]
MNYQVLARKWRPRTFHELVGQEHAVRALTNALDRQRLHHAFLFTGTRGVGKTTIARILAKSLNCEVGVSSKPCGECSACQEIDTGRFVDLIEVDAASRTKVDETRELLENVQYAPSRGRFKVYLIDEVHMFSNHSFNALLKTLEEPPPHVKFLLATTDPQKLPVTILSRCLQFSLKRLPANMIARYLDHILVQEAIPHETAALQLVARAGDGSMRDALSLLDQAIAFGGGQVETATVSAMLGSIDRRQVTQLLEMLATNNAPGLLQQIAVLDEHTPDYSMVLAELLSLLQRVALAQVVPNAPTDDEAADPEEVRRFAEMLLPEDIQLFYQIALLGRRDLPLAPDSRGGFEMVLLRMLCFRPA